MGFAFILLLFCFPATLFQMPKPPCKAKPTSPSCASMRRWLCVTGTYSARAGLKHTMTSFLNHQVLGLQAELPAFLICNFRKSFLKSWWALEFVFYFVLFLTVRSKCCWWLSLRAKVAQCLCECCCCNSATVSPPYLAAFFCNFRAELSSYNRVAHIAKNSFQPFKRKLPDLWSGVSNFL